MYLQVLSPLPASKAPHQPRCVILGTVCAWERGVLLSELVLRGFQRERNQLNGERLYRKNSCQQTHRLPPPHLKFMKMERGFLFSISEMRLNTLLPKAS